ncbi:MAG: heparinase II/III family protein, partial [Candidatus Latescibacteria bacterium]|nr:heparinase II/III family protein [Candidatus Latescibacterota bacterium]
MIWIAASLVCVLLCVLRSGPALAKEGTVLYTAEEIENAHRNVRRYAWAQQELDDLVASCRPWLERSDDEIWGMVTGQSILRGIHVNRDLGCPSCGREITNRFGGYPWLVSIDRPWKLECPSCGEVFPKNDFAAFRASGLGPGGTFHRDRADESLLRNEDTTGPDDPEITYGVDDGQGWIDGEGNRWFFVPYYTHWCIWTELPNAALALGEAYLRTGDPSYAHKGAVLLDRIADLYPAMDLTPCTELGLHNSHGGSGVGRVKGCIWETGLSETLSKAYDMVYEGMAGDEELVRFLSDRSRSWDTQIDKSSIDAIRSNIETGLLREFIKSCRDRRIRGNEGSTHKAMAAAAVVLDDPVETPEALDWLFQPGDVFKGGGHIPATLIGQVDRDGVGNEAAPGYCFGWMRNFRECAGILERCRSHGDYDLYRDFPRLRRMLAAPYRLTALDQYTPGIGDSGQTGNPGMVAVTVENAVEAFRRFSDPYFAQLACKLNGDRVEGLHTSVFDEDPEAIRVAIRDVVDCEGSLELGSANLNGYGLAMFRCGSGDARRAAWLYYGRNGGHGHKDRLGFGLFYRGMDILPDLGYPEYANADWPKNRGWTKNTISHNTVQVDRKAQEISWIGRCSYFSASGEIGVAEVASPDVYPGTEDYRRTLAMIDLSESESYLVDIF